jgi:membrane protein DedA with SNARE-associated domain
MWWLTATYFPLALVSALVPWVNAELIMLSAVPLAKSPQRLGLLVGVITLGQMTGKTVMYWSARRAKRPPLPRLEALLARWNAYCHRRRGASSGVMLLSAVFGFPPFYLVSIAAGILGVAFGRFLAIGIAGRLIHFGTIAFVPHLAWRGV